MFAIFANNVPELETYTAQNSNRLTSLDIVTQNTATLRIYFDSQMVSSAKLKQDLESMVSEIRLFQ